MKYPHKHVGDKCFKCGVGFFDVKHFISEDLRVMCNDDCQPAEHLHLACTKCGYLVWEKTAEQRQSEHDKAKV